MRFIIYRNSVLASFLSIFGTGLAAMGVFTLFEDFSTENLMIAIPAAAIGIGLNILANIISKRKEQKKRAKAGGSAAAGSAPSAQTAQSGGYSAAGYVHSAQTAQSSGYTAQSGGYSAQHAPVYQAPAAQARPVKKRCAAAAILFLLTALLEFVSLYMRNAQDPWFTLNSEEVALVAMGALLMIAALRSRHIQQVSILNIFGFLGFTLGSVDVALCAYQAYGTGGYATSNSIYYAVFAAPALKAAAYLLMALFALLATRKIKAHCGGVVRWLWWIPLLALALAYSKEISDSEVLWRLRQVASRRSGFMGLQFYTRPELLHVYAIVLQVLAVLLTGLYFCGLCRKTDAVYNQGNYVPPVQPQPEMRYAAPEPPQPEMRYAAPEPPQPEMRYAAPEPPQPEPAPRASDVDVQKQIQAYRDLLDCGILSQEEYDSKVSELTRG